jgi:hypothetical protein
MAHCTCPRDFFIQQQKEANSVQTSAKKKKQTKTRIEWSALSNRWHCKQSKDSTTRTLSQQRQLQKD